MKKILITGGAGFIGSNFIKQMLDKYDDYIIVNLDLLTYAGNLNNLKGLENNKDYIFIKGSIASRNLVENLFKKYKFDFVINFAAETHVDKSILGSDIFVMTNVLGTQVLLDVCKKYWIDIPDNIDLSKKKFIQISTDEVYGTLGEKGLFTETSLVSPNNPYSASKASSDMLVRAYHKTYGLPINIIRCSNNYGPFQYPEKLIPLMISNCLQLKKLPVYGDGLQIRDWVYVKDHCRAIDIVLHKGVDGEIYNIGGNNEKTNIEIVKLIIKTLGKSESLIKYVKDRLGHDRRYAIDNTKITTQLGWRPAYTFEQGMKETIEWYLYNNDWIENIVSGDYIKYYEQMYSNLHDEIADEKE